MQIAFELQTVQLLKLWIYMTLKLIYVRKTGIVECFRNLWCHDRKWRKTFRRYIGTFAMRATKFRRSIRQRSQPPLKTKKQRSSDLIDFFIFSIFSVICEHLMGTSTWASWEHTLYTFRYRTMPFRDVNILFDKTTFPIVRWSRCVKLARHMTDLRNKIEIS